MRKKGNPCVLHNHSHHYVEVVVESVGKCSQCDEISTLGNGKCKKCWDKVPEKEAYKSLLTKLILVRDGECEPI